MRPRPLDLSPLHAAYAARVPDGDVVELLRTQAAATARLFESLSDEELAWRYAPGKWTPREVLGHLVDVEWVFGYRALRFSRGDGERLAGMDEARFAAGSGAARRPLASLLTEFLHLRGATTTLFASLDEEQWRRRGLAADFALSPGGIAFFLAGHEAHHVDVLRERYLARFPAPADADEE